MKVLWLVCCVVMQLVFGVVSAQPALAVEGKSLKIAMVLWRGETMAEQGLKDELKELGYAVEYVTYNVDQDKERLAEALRAEIAPKVGDFNYVYCFGTTAISMAKSILRDKVPLFFNAVSTPVEIGVVNSLDAPGGNISGVTNMIPVKQQLEEGRRLIPITRLGIMYNTREKNGVLRAEEAAELAEKLNLEVVDLSVSPEGHQLEHTLQKIIEKKVTVDAVFLPSDSFLISQAKFIGEKLGEAKVPSIAAQMESIKGGALVGLVPDYYDLGRMAAGIVDQNQKGRKMGEIPVARSNNPKLVVNKKTCDLLGIQLPKGIADSAHLIE